MAKTVKKSVIPPADKDKGESNDGVTALPGDANPVIPTDGEPDPALGFPDLDGDRTVIGPDTQTVTALPGDGNPLLANLDADPELDPEKAKRASRGKTTIILDGEGTAPIFGNGAMRRVDRGEPIKVNAAELDYIQRAGISHTATEPDATDDDN